ncbi:T7SS effector LXG polymorphic toxin [Peribacillus sp. Hz7]|uniref:T7SS effector LXG polymorphic toxin n=1 Tax=Peribacillus sp. Hz7 TaxID=3344873 RepID=UPI0035CBDE70
MEMKIYEADTLVHSVEERAKQYKALKEQFQQLKIEFAKIVDNGNFLGNGAEAIKGFYEAQIDVVDVWILLIDQQVAFFEGIQGMTEDVQLSGDTVVKVPFLEENLSQSNQLAKEMVTQQQEDLQQIFNDIEDLISLQVFSKEEFDENINEAEKERNETIQKVNKLDEDLTTEYALSEQTETYVYALFNQLIEATRKGENISPLYFNANTYKTSEIYQLKDDVAKQTNQYLTFKKDQHEARELAKEIEAQENRPWYEKAWEATKTFTGEITGYYDTKRAVEGVDPVTGRKLSEAERITAGAMAAAGFIPVVGWAGRAFKGGKAIYSTAKGLDAASTALDAYKTSKSLSILQKSEMGIYGLVSANGLSEAMLGKDMFGNELTDEQRQNSLLTALGIVGVAGAAKLVDKAGTNFPYSKAYIQQQVQHAQTILKDMGRAGYDTLKNVGKSGTSTAKAIGRELGKVKVPTGIKAEQLLASNGTRFVHVGVDKTQIKDLVQKFAVKKSSGNTIDTGMVNGVAGANGVKTLVGAGEQFTNGRKNRLKPDIRYKTGEYDYFYETDSVGRVVKFETENLQLTTRTERLSHSKNTPGKVKGQDHAGHLAGDRFGGSPKIDNLVSQLSDVNLKQYKKIEEEWATALKETPPKEVTVDVEIIYSGNDMRPKKFIVNYSIDGELGFEVIEN